MIKMPESLTFAFKIIITTIITIIIFFFDNIIIHLFFFFLSKQGGYPFHIELYRELSPDIVAGTVEFHGVSYVPANRIMNSSVLTGNVPCKSERPL